MSTAPSNGRGWKLAAILFGVLEAVCLFILGIVWNEIHQTSKDVTDIKVDVAVLKSQLGTHLKTPTPQVYQNSRDFATNRYADERD